MDKASQSKPKSSVSAAPAKPLFQPRPFAQETAKPASSSSTLSPEAIQAKIDRLSRAGDLTQMKFNFSSSASSPPAPTPESPTVQRQPEEAEPNRPPEILRTWLMPRPGQPATLPPQKSQSPVAIQRGIDLTQLKLNWSSASQSRLQRQEVASETASEADELQPKLLQRQPEEESEELQTKPIQAGIQAKLTVGAPNDRYEQEADSVAEKVMTMPEPNLQAQTASDPEKEEEPASLQMKPLAAEITPLVQGQEVHEEEEVQTKALQREAQPEEEEPVQTKLAVQREAAEGQEEEEVQPKPLAASITPLVQREAMPEEEEVQTKAITSTLQREAAPEEEEVQTKPFGDTVQREAVPEEKPEEEEVQTKPLATHLQREADSEEEESVQTKAIAHLQRSAAEEEEPVQAKAISAVGNFRGTAVPRMVNKTIQRKAAVPSPTPHLESQLAAQKGGGSPLSDEVRSYMEPRFGSDFSQVRVHTDASAVQMNQDLRAQAFTHGSDIYYGAGKAPGNDALTAHELTHTIQQTGGVRAKPVSLLQKKENKPQDIRLAAEAVPNQTASVESPKPTEPVWQPPVAQDKSVQPGIQDGAAAPGSQESGKTPAPGNPAVSGIGAVMQAVSKISKVIGGKGAEGAPGQAVGGERAGTPKDKVPEGKASEGKVPEGKPEKVVAGGAVGAGTGAGSILPNSGGGNSTGDANLADAKTAPASSQQDPAFQAVIGKVKQVGQQQKQHEPAAVKSQEAQSAAIAPPKEVESKAQANQVGQMEQAETPPFNGEAFKAALMKKIAEATPKNLEEADEFKKNNKLESVKGDLGGKVKDEQQATQKPLEDKAKQAPDTSGIEPKPVTPMSPPQPGQAPAAIGAEQAVPKLKGQGEVEAPIQADSQKVDQKLAEANVTEEQLAKSNEPEFQDALKSKQTAQTHAAQVPQEYRQFEQGQLAQAKVEAKATAQDKTQGMHADRTQLLGRVGGQQVDTKGKDEQQRAKVAGDINKIYLDTKTKVDNSLKDLDKQVGEKFDAGATKAKQDFENYVEQKMNAYKEKRYNFSKDPIGAAALWVWDKLAGMPSEVNAFYEEGRNLYLKQMDGTIDQVVAIVGKGLNQAKTEVAAGKRQVQTYVAQLPENLKTIGQQAASEIQGKFGELEQSIESKKDQLVDTLAQKYKEKLDEVDASIKEKKEANRGLIDKAIDAVVGVVKTIIELSQMLLKVLARIANVIPQIIKDPIGFFNNLVSGLKQGFQNFASNILQHLKKGLISWLTGALAGAGFQIPEKFDLQGIFTLLAQVLGLGYEMIRARLVERFGAERVSYLEKNVKIFQMLVAKGIGGIWKFIQEKIGDLKAMFLDNIQGFIIESVITAGITWLMSLTNPASAFIRACKAIYDLVQFFMENAQRIASFINTLLDSIVSIAAGNVSQVAKNIESTLAQAIPLVIDMLAGLLGLGNISEKIRSIIQKLQKPIKAAIDWVIEKAVKLAKKVGKFAKKVGGKIGNKLGFGKGKAKDNKEKKDKGSKPDERTMEQKEADVHKAIIEAEKTMEEKGATPDGVKAKLPTIQSMYNLTSIKLVKEKSNKYHVEVKINPGGDSESKPLRDDIRKPATIKKILFETNSSYKDSEGNKLFGDELKEKFESFQRGLLDEKLASRKQTYKEIRGEDKKWAELQGVIYAPFIRDNQQAISKLQEKVEGCKYLISLERGGSFLAEQIARGQRIIVNEKQRTPNISIEKPASQEYKAKYKAKHQEELKNKIIEIMRKQKNENITIAIAETLVGGGSRDALIKTANEILDTGEYPNLKFKLLLLQQTIHTEDEGEGIVEQGITRVSGMMKAHQIQLVTASIRYILGEDVGYQLAKNGSDSTKPVIVFQGTETEMIAYQITPTDETTARDIIVDLNAGLYAGLLPPIL